MFGFTFTRLNPRASRYNQAVTFILPNASGDSKGGAQVLR
jgi:hypothetical protein